MGRGDTGRPSTPSRPFPRVAFRDKAVRPPRADRSLLLTGAGPRSAAPSDPLTLGQLGPLGPPAGRGRAFYLAGGGSPRLRRIICDLPRLLCPRGKRRGPRVLGVLSQITFPGIVFPAIPARRGVRAGCEWHCRRFGTRRCTACVK